jgi:hypothetical protein
MSGPNHADINSRREIWRRQASGENSYAFVHCGRFFTLSMAEVGMADAQDIFMLLRPENRALRALLWLVIALLPGGLFVLALFAADTAARRYRGAQRSPDADLGQGPLSGLGSSQG